jgi:hypothetical protein
MPFDAFNVVVSASEKDVVVDELFESSLKSSNGMIAIVR